MRRKKAPRIALLCRAHFEQVMTISHSSDFEQVIIEIVILLTLNKSYVILLTFNKSWLKYSFCWHWTSHNWNSHFANSEQVISHFANFEQVMIKIVICCFWKSQNSCGRNRICMHCFFSCPTPFSVIPHSSVDYRQVFRPLLNFQPSPWQSDSRFYPTPFWMHMHPLFWFTRMWLTGRYATPEVTYTHTHTHT